MVRNRIWVMYWDCRSGPCNSVVSGLQVGTMSRCFGIAGRDHIPPFGPGYSVPPSQSLHPGGKMVSLLCNPSTREKWCPSSAIPPPGGEIMSLLCNPSTRGKNGVALPQSLQADRSIFIFRKNAYRGESGRLSGGPCDGHLCPGGWHYG